MTVKAIWFDLDDTLLWDERSVTEALRATALLAAERTGVDPDALVAAVRREAPALYAAYETYPFTQMIGINPFEGLWGRFSGGSHPMFRKLEAIVPEYRVDVWTRGLGAGGVQLALIHI